jgi:peptidoglycan hydrolase-like protein with peptidoglycan-binding domain
MRFLLRLRPLAVLPAVAVLLAAPGCSSKLTEEKARAAEKRARETMQPLDQGALEQELSKEMVTKVQTELTTLKEYMGPINGKLDQVTLNALESFQRRNDIRADGRFNDKTLSLLESTSKQKG